MAFWNPIDIVLAEELLVRGQALVVDLGVAPSVQNVPALASVSPRLACRFFGGGAVVDDVNLMHATAGDGDLVEGRVVINPVAVHPIRSSCGVARSASIVDVDAARMVLHHPIVVFGWVIILDEVVPCMPFPNHVGTVVAHGLDFDDVVGPDVVLSTRRVAGNFGIPPRLKRFGLGSFFPRNHQDVAVGHGFNIVV